MTDELRIVHVAAELSPWCKTGGLADVAAALPDAQARAGHQVIRFCPLYRPVRLRIAEQGRPLLDTGVQIEFELHEAKLHGRILRLDDQAAAPTYFVDNPALYDREGLYAEGSGPEFEDNALRFAFLCRAALDAAPSS